MKRRALQFNYHQVLFILELFILIPVDYFDNVTVIDVTFKYIRIFILLWEVFLLWGRTHSFEKIKIDRGLLQLFISLFAFTFVQFAIDLVKNTSYVVASINYIISILCLIFVIHRKCKENFNETCKLISLFAFLVILINLVTILLFPNGLYTENLHEGLSHLHICYFLGISNQYAGFILPMLTILFFYLSISSDSIKYTTIIKWISIIMVILTFAITFSGTGIVLAVGFIVLSFFCERRWAKRIFDIRFLLVAFVVIFLLLVIMQIALENIEIINYFIVEVLNRSLTFSGRTVIWQQAIRLIGEAPIFGYGNLAGGLYVHYANSYYSAHNVFLQILLEAGIIGLLPFISSIFVSVKQMIKTVNNVKGVKIIYLGLFFTLMYFMFEYTDLYAFVTLIIIAVEYTLHQKETQLVSSN